MSYSRSRKPSVLEQIKARREARRERTAQLAKNPKINQPEVSPPSDEQVMTAPQKKAKTKAEPIAKSPAKKATTKKAVRSPQDRKTSKTTKAKAAPTKKPKADKVKAKPETIASIDLEPVNDTIQEPSHETEQPAETDAIQDLYNERERAISRIEALEDELQAEIGNLEAVDTILSALLPDPTLALESPFTPATPSNPFLLEDIEYEIAKR